MTNNQPNFFSFTVDSPLLMWTRRLDSERGASSPCDSGSEPKNAIDPWISHARSRATRCAEFEARRFSATLLYVQKQFQ
ncbi:hypothetical protein [Paraburkholderia xenovorans]|uniref:hypothetical protein n=1 Tax=Paraburkholderia xenovorans TaxID=36873 RepID=UPI0011D17390|nr:hypothetical protein [Paraburkholderia xenovorans]